MDIKLDNILLDANFNIKMTDFGFACHVSGERGTGYSEEFKGTGNYSRDIYHTDLGLLQEMNT